MKRILILANINSSHTQKWVNAISNEFEVGLFSLTAPTDSNYLKSRIKLLNDSFISDNDLVSKSDLSKTGYIKQYFKFRKIIKQFSPDIIHAHYATSYGMFAALSGRHPFIVSAWGSDVFEFPGRSMLHRVFLKWIFGKADLILSTSKVMKQEIEKYTTKIPQVTYFGVDTNIFRKEGKRSGEEISIGIVKALERTYGIDILIKAFEKLIQKYPEKKLLLEITGNGTERENYENLVAKMNLEGKVIFNGKISHEDIPRFLNKTDIFVCPSRHESFGVSVLEASACEIPVIVTNVGGLPEVMQNGMTGTIIPSENIDALADAIGYFIDNPEEARAFGIRGREFVKTNFDWNESVKLINDIYHRY